MPNKKLLEIVDDQCPACGAEHMFTDIIENIVYHICKVCGHYEEEKDGNI
jgi:uncharacterized protein (DUF983 family)